MLKRIFATATALALLTAPAFAAVPAISGKYALGASGTCQAIQSGSVVGLIESLNELANFDSTTGMVKFTGTGIFGDLVVWTNGTSGYETKTINQTQTYSNTATTVTVNGITYNIVYGPVKNGIAQSAIYNGFDANGCPVTGVAIRQ